MPEINVPKWEGSLASSLNIEDMTPGDFTDLRNFYYDSSGTPTVRGGRRFLNSTQIAESGVGVPIGLLYHFQSGWISGLSRDWLIAYAGTKILKADQDGVFNPIWTGLPSGLHPSACALRGWLILATGSEKQPRPLYWDGAMGGMAELSKAPYGTIVTSYSGRLWVVDRDSPSKLWYSVPYEPNNWDLAHGAGFLTIGPGDGSEISALVPGYAGELIVFKDGPQGGAIYRVQGLAEPFSVAALSTTIGCVSQRAVTMIADKDIYFASRRGIHSLQRVFQHGDLDAVYIDKEISDIWRGLPEQRKKNAVAVDDYNHDTWWLFIDTTNSGENDQALLWNYRFQTPRQNPKISQMDFGAESATIFRETRSGHDLLVTGGADGYVRIEHCPESKDQTAGGLVDYPWSAELGLIDANDAFRIKAWYDWHVSHDNWGYGNLTGTWYGDNRAPQSATESMNPAGAPIPFQETRVGEFRGFPPRYRAWTHFHLHDGGTTIKLKLSGDHGRVRLRGFTLSFELRKEAADGHTWFSYTGTQARTQ
jgi:hypothetical protein